MMSDLDILRELIRDDAIVPNRKSNSTATITLKESGDGHHSCYNINILGAPDETITINIDKNFPPTTKIFNGTKGECKRADFVLITDYANKKWIIYIEMKLSNNTKRPEFIKQFKGTQCFITYCKSIGRKFWGQPNFLEVKGKKYQERFVGIANISLDKKPTVYTKPNNSKHDKPENMLKINCPGKNLHISKLTNRPSC